MSSRPIRILIDDIWEAIERTQQYTAGMSPATFGEDAMCIDAVARNFEIMGEAANRLPDEFTEKHAEVEWYKIVGLRNRVIHEYFGVDLDIVWQIIQHDLPSLKSSLERIRTQGDY